MSIVDRVAKEQHAMSVRSGYGLLLRRMQVFASSARVFADYKLCKWRTNQLDEVKDKEKIDKIWEKTHQRKISNLH